MDSVRGALVAVVVARGRARRELPAAVLRLAYGTAFVSLVLAPLAEVGYAGYG